MASGDDPFIIGPTECLTFAEADRASLELAARLLAAGIGKGSRVGLLYANTPAWVVAWLAAARLGALTVPLSTFAPGPELALTIRGADVHAVLLSPQFGTTDLVERFEDGLPGLAASGPAIVLPDVPFLRWVHVEGGGPSWSARIEAAVPDDVALAAQAEVHPSDDLVLISTSGTTAAPKMVVHTHGSLVRHAALLAERRGLTRDDRIYSPMPFFWVGGLTMVVLAALTSGAAAVVHERFEPGEALALIERERVTQVSCWPNAARALADHPSFASRDLSAVSGGTLIEALPPAKRPSSPDLAPNVLGMSETGGPHTGTDEPYVPLPEHLRGAFGRSLPGMEHRIVDPNTGQPAPAGAEGELMVRGAFLMDGLYKRERRDTFDGDGWYATGDFGWFDEYDQLHFTGRRTPMIKSGGANVSPAEVEAALCEVAGVRAAFVFAVPARDRGEDVAAVIVVDADGAPGMDELLAAVRERLASYKVPRKVRLVVEDEVPVLPTGKVDLARLRGLFAAVEG
jgi:acyl-CoA synthetase (AMP-forming)/AMP-acid ligase II